MSHFGTHTHRSRLIFPSSRKESDLRFELGASKATWSHWFRREKAFATKTDNRTYAQVVSHNKPCNLVSNSHPEPVPKKPTKNFNAIHLTVLFQQIALICNGLYIINAVT